MTRTAAGARRLRRTGGRLAIPLLLFLSLACLALGYVAYVLWPRWPEAAVALDAPALPIVVAGTMFNIPPAAIRMAVQRHPGTQDRIDLVYLWPSLTPPEPAGKRGSGTPQWPGRVFVTIAADADAMAPAERFKMIYPRYAAARPSPGPDGLTVFAFRDDTPYQGEDVVFDPTAPERFLVRCSRAGSALTPGVCLYERFISAAKLTVRFPRDWLANWRTIVTGVDQLIEQWRPAAG